VLAVPFAQFYSRRNYNGIHVYFSWRCAKHDEETMNDWTDWMGRVMGMCFRVLKKLDPPASTAVEMTELVVISIIKADDGGGPVEVGTCDYVEMISIR